MKKINIAITATAVVALASLILTLTKCSDKGMGGAHHGGCCCCGSGSYGGGKSLGGAIGSGKPTTIVMAPGLPGTVGNVVQSGVNFRYYEFGVNVGANSASPDEITPVDIVVSNLAGSYGHSHIEYRDPVSAPPPNPVPPGPWATSTDPEFVGASSYVATIPGGSKRMVRVRVLVDMAYAPIPEPVYTPGVNNYFCSTSFTLTGGAVAIVSISDQAYLAP
jgi:hypothetical protein